MTKRKALDGKAYAGNPHVTPSQCHGDIGRFDEEEVALTATPRRGSPLYNNQKVCSTGILHHIALAAIAMVNLAYANTPAIGSIRPTRFTNF